MSTERTLDLPAHWEPFLLHGDSSGLSTSEMRRALEAAKSAGLLRSACVHATEPVNGKRTYTFLVDALQDLTMGFSKA